MVQTNDSLNVEIRVPGEPYALSLIRKIVTHVASQSGLPEEEVNKIEIAVDEACANVMEHGYRNCEPKPPVSISLQVINNELVIDIVDTGDAFDRDTYSPPTFPDHWDQGNVRGLGVFLIEQCVDDSDYEVIPGKQNRLRLVKRLA